MGIKSPMRQDTLTQMYEEDSESESDSAEFDAPGWTKMLDTTTGKMLYFHKESRYFTHDVNETGKMAAVTPPPIHSTKSSRPTQERNPSPDRHRSAQIFLIPTPTVGTEKDPIDLLADNSGGETGDHQDNTCKVGHLTQMEDSRLPTSDNCRTSLQDSGEP